MWLFGFCTQGHSLQRCTPALLCVFTLCFCQGCRALQVWTEGGESGKNVSEFSVPVMLLLTETGVAQNGANEGATPAPTTEHEDDNSLGYTGTAPAFSWFLMSLCVPMLALGNVKLVWDNDWDKMLLNLFTGNFITDLIRACAFTRPHSSVEKCRRGGHHLMTVSSKQAHTKDSSLEKMTRWWHVFCSGTEAKKFFLLCWSMRRLRGWPPLVIYWTLHGFRQREA